MVDRFRKLKEEEKRKKSSKALADEEVQTLDSASRSDEDSDEDATDKVNAKFKFFGTVQCDIKMDPLLYLM